MNSPKVMRNADGGWRIEKSRRQEQEAGGSKNRLSLSCLLPLPPASYSFKSAFRIPHSAIVWVCLLMLAAIAAHAQEQPSANLKASEGSSSVGIITGRIISDDGRPLPDAAVYFYRVYATTPGPPQSVSTDSD